MVECRLSSCSLHFQIKCSFFIGSCKFSMGWNPDPSTLPNQKGKKDTSYIQCPVLSICSSCAPLQRAAVMTEGGHHLQWQDTSHHKHLNRPHKKEVFTPFQIPTRAKKSLFLNHFMMMLFTYHKVSHYTHTQFNDFLANLQSCIITNSI